jgi:hypothetical protein
MEITMNRSAYLAFVLLTTAAFGINAQTTGSQTLIQPEHQLAPAMMGSQNPTLMANPAQAPAQPLQPQIQQPDQLSLSPQKTAAPVLELPTPSPAVNSGPAVAAPKPAIARPSAINPPPQNSMPGHPMGQVMQLKKHPTLEETRAQMQQGKWPDPSICINPTPAAKKNVCLPPKLSLGAKSPVKSGTTFTPVVEFSYVQSAELVAVDLKTNQRSVVWRFSNGDPGRYYYPADLKIPSVTINNNTRLQLIAKNPYYPIPSVANKGIVFSIIQIQPATGSQNNTILLPGQNSTTPMAGFAGGVVNAPNTGGFATLNHNPSCNPSKDAWGCRKPQIVSIVLSQQGQDILDGKKGNPIGQQINFTLIYSNAEKLEVSAPYKHFSPLTIISKNALTPKQNVSVSVPLTIRQQSFSLAIEASNPHGTAQLTRNYSTKYDTPPQLTSQWKDHNGSTTTVDPGELVNLTLEQVVNTDTIGLKLITAPSECAGSAFRDSGSDTTTVTNPLGMANHRTTLSIPVLPSACPGKSYTIYAEITPMQNRVVVQSAKRLSQKLQVTGPKLANPKIISFKLTAKNRQPNGVILAGDDVTIDMEFVNADEIIVKSHDGSTILTRNTGFGRKYVKGPLFFKADDAFARGFDVIVQATGANQTLQDSKRIIPTVRRKIKLTSTVKWDVGNATKTVPANIEVSCSVTNNKQGSVYATKVLSLAGRNTGIQSFTYDLEMPLRGDSQDTSKVSYSCSATSKGPSSPSANVLIGHGTVSEPLPYTFATWPVKEVTINTQTLQLSNL